MTTQHKPEPASLVATVPVAPAGRAVVPIPPAPTPVAIGSRRGKAGRVALFALIAAIVTGGGWFAWFQPMSVTVVQPRRGAAMEAVYATGIVEAVQMARVGTTVAGRIVSLAVDEGDAVRAGQVLAQLDDRQPRHRLEDVSARLTQAQQELTRSQDLVARGVRTRQEAERVQEERDQALAGVRLATRQVDEHRITAPLDGVVSKRPVEVGETVAAHQTLFEVVSDILLRVVADVDERDIPLVRLGAATALRSEAFPDEPFVARITNIRRAGETSTRTFRVEADLPAGTKLRIGMTVDVNIVVAERAGVVLVPALAVRNDPPLGGRPGPAYVFRVEDHRAVRTPVETGAVGAEVIEVRAGLTDTATIVAAPPTGLRDGQRVRVQARPVGAP